MSSLVERFASAVGVSTGPKAPASVADIEIKIADARARIVNLQRDHARACLAWADSGEASERDRLSNELETARVNIASLQSALAMARERNGQDERRRLAALNASRLQSMVVHLRALNKHAGEFADAMAKAAEARRKMLEKAGKARASAPSPLPKGSLTEAGVIDALLAGEMHRLSCDPSTPKRKGTGALPGSKPPSLQLKDDPASIVPLVDQLRQAHDFSINVVKGEIAIERTPLIEAQLVSDTAQLTATAKAVVAEPAEFNLADLLPGTRGAAEIQASIPRAKLSLAEDE